jgi:1-acyl-sn-glycerol-3-phosphate acyltransferase
MRLDLDFPIVESHYRSPDWKPGWFTRRFPSLSFYRRVVGIVFSASSKAKKGQYDDKGWVESSHATLRALEAVGVSVSIEHLEHIQSIEGPCVFVGNHMSTLETFVLPFLIAPHRPVTFVVKKSLVEYPVFKHVMISRDPVVVGRENAREDLRAMMDGGCTRLQNGVSIIVFPQTTRSADFDPEQFNSIGVKLAKRAQVPVVPVALKTDAWSNGKRLKDFGPVFPDRKVHFAFGEPMTISGNGADQQKAIVEFIQTKLKSWSES